jgi:hypothetical protein
MSDAASSVAIFIGVLIIGFCLGQSYEARKYERRKHALNVLMHVYAGERYVLERYIAQARRDFPELFKAAQDQSGRPN